MNKLFTKIAALVLGMTMTVGVGVAFGTSGKEASPVHAGQADFTLNSAADVTVDGITASFAKASGSTAPTWYAAGLRLYAKNTVTISSNDPTITGITFNWEKQGSKAFCGVTANTGTYSHPSSTGVGTWTGSAKSIVFTLANSGQLQLNTFSVTYSGGSSAVATTTTISAEPDKNTLDVSTVDDQIVLTATVKDNNEATISDASVEYSVEPAGIVTMSGSGLSRTITPDTVGTATITVSYDGVTDTYLPSSAEFEITVIDSSVTDVTFDAKTDKGTSPIVKSGITYACSSGVLNNGSEYRMYKNSTTTFSISSGSITRIDFTGVSGNPASGFESQTGWTTSDNDGTWVGSASQVTFVASGAQVRATLIKVAFSGDVPATGHDITFNKNTEDEVTDMPETLTGQTGTVSLEDVSIPSRDGYTFSGWSLTSTGEIITEVTITDSDVEVFAIWAVAPTPVATAKRCYSLVTSTDGLVAGAKYIIAGNTTSGAYYALSTTQNTNNRGQESIAVSGTVASVTSNAVEVITLGGSTGAWTFGVTGGYLYAASTSKNYLRTQETNDSNGEWAISISNNGVVTAEAQGDNTHNLLQYNSSNSIFSAYSGAQRDIYLYRLDFEATVLGNITCSGSGSHTLPEGYTWNSDLKAVFDDLPSSEKETLAGKTAEVDSGLERYDYIIGKYNPKGETDTSKTDYIHFITGRAVKPLTNSRIIFDVALGNNGNNIAIVVIVSVVSLTAIGGYFFLRKKREQN